MKFRLLNKELNTQDYTEQTLDLSNYKRVIAFAFVMAIIEVGMLIYSFIYPEGIDADMITLYRWMYVALAIISSMSWILAKKVVRTNQARPIDRYLLLFAAFLIVLWSAQISLWDLANGDGFYVYMTFVLIISVTLRARPSIFLVIFGTVHLYFLLRMEIWDTGIIINSTIVVIFAWILGRMFYNHDIESQKKDHRIHTLIYTDTLTNVPNRRSFFEKGEELFSQHHNLYAVIIDIDNFKQINDTFGHPTGDYVLVEIAKTLYSHISSECTFGRVGGEEFAILIPSKDTDYVVSLVENMRLSIQSQSIETPDHGPISVTISAGVEQKKDTHNHLDALLSDADKSLYIAKDTGRNRVIFRGDRV